MLIILSIVIVVLIVVSSLLVRKLVQQKQEMKKLNNIIHTVENVKDIIYYCRMPEIEYHYLSPVIDNVLGPNALKENLANPRQIFKKIHPDDHETMMKKISGTLDYSKTITIRIQNDAGEYIWFEEYATPVYENGKYVGLQGIYRNISDKVKLQQELQYKVTHDALTNLYNRAYFEAKLNAYNEEIDVAIALVICDLDNLKYVNDHYGHKAGDEFIQKAAAILEQAVKGDEFVARIGGDEFGFILPGADEARVHEMFAQIEQAVQIANEQNTLYKIECSKGYVCAPSSLGQMRRLYNEADNQMYAHKKTKVRYREVVASSN